MSFFGLTAFGPENFIQSSLVRSTGIISFKKVSHCFPMKNFSLASLKFASRMNRNIKLFISKMLKISYTTLLVLLL